MQQLTQRQYFLLHNAQTSTSPLMLEAARAEGSFIYDVAGKKYIDLISGISVSNVGHRHPKVLKAIHEQLDKYMHLMVYGEFVITPQVALAKYINDLLEPELGEPVSTYFTNSGAEATEGAMKLAKRYTGRKKFVSCHQAYHGHTQGAMSLMSDEGYNNTYGPLLPGVSFISYNALDQLDLIDEETAAVFLEVVQSETGYCVGTDMFLEGVYNRCREVGALLVIDEIQTGCGRTGSMFAYQQASIKPDILLLAKGFGGGMPIGAFIAPSRIMNTLSHEPILGHLTTFGGHPVCCAAALAAMQVIEEEKLAQQAVKLGGLIRKHFNTEHGITTQGKGLMQSIDFKSYDFNKKIIDACLEGGVISDWFLFSANRMRISPPLTIDQTDLEEALFIISNILHKHT